jgi:hypothetical protein
MLRNEFEACVPIFMLALRFDVESKMSKDKISKKMTEIIEFTPPDSTRRR